MADIKQIKVGSSTYDIVDSAGRYEANLQWGGKNFSGSYGAIDACLNPVLSPNRLAGMKPAGITVEYSNDAGATWTDYGLTDAQKTSLVTTSQTIRVGGSSGSIDANARVRVILDGVDGSVYTQLLKFHIYLSTNYSQSTTVTMESYDYNSSTDWHTVISNQAVAGWSGWNILNFTLPGTGAFGGTNSATHQRKIRLTFAHTSISSGHETAGLQILKIYAYGGVGWTTPSMLASDGVPFQYNYQGNIKTMNGIYPQANSCYTLGTSSYKWSNVYATTFTGALTGNVTGNCSGSSGSCTGNSATATKATQDASGNVITSTYATKAELTAAIGTAIGDSY